MSTYYAYLSSLRQSDVVSRNQWNALVGEEQATDDLLIGSLYPWANVISTSTDIGSPTFISPTLATSWKRFYRVSGEFKNPNNPNLIDLVAPSYPVDYYMHRILVPGFYAWNIVWGETIASATDDQVIAVKVRKYVDQSYYPPDPSNDALFRVIGEHRSVTTSWAQNVNDRYYQPASTTFGMGFPLRSYSGMHYFNAPPYNIDGYEGSKGIGYEYVLFEFSSSNISSLAPNNYFSRMIGPNITFMKVR